mmetsp:Transcript_13360/g.17316  ORF Transcript_13360/g.17316 Transcript_13360/m.17316 type:complete len:599 (+) Transcript_13360:139-1935(+)
MADEDSVPINTRAHRETYDSTMNLPDELFGDSRDSDAINLANANQQDEVDEEELPTPPPKDVWDQETPPLPERGPLVSSGRRRNMQNTANKSDLRKLKEEWEDEISPKKSFNSIVYNGAAIDEDGEVEEASGEQSSYSGQKIEKKRTHFSLPKKMKSAAYTNESVMEDSVELSDVSKNSGRKKRTIFSIPGGEPETSELDLDKPVDLKSYRDSKMESETCSWSSSEDQNLSTFQKSVNENGPNHGAPSGRRFGTLGLIPQGMVSRRKAVLDSIAINNMPLNGLSMSSRIRARRSTYKEMDEIQQDQRPSEIPKGMVWSKKANKGRGGLVYIPPLSNTIPQNMFWSLTANHGMGGLAFKEPPAEEIPKGWAWSRTAQNGRGALVKLPPPAETIPAGMKWSNQADKGRGALVYIPPPPHDIPAGMTWRQSVNGGRGGLVNIPPSHIPPDKQWSDEANDGLGGLINRRPSVIPRGQRWSGSANNGLGALVKVKHRNGVFSAHEESPVSSANKMFDSLAAAEKETQNGTTKKSTGRRRKLNKPRMRRRNTRNEPIRFSDWGIVVEEEEPSEFEGVDLSNASEGSVFSRKSYFEKWLRELTDI